MDRRSQTYSGLLAGTYDCLDRIVLNAYFRLGHDAGGFHVWWPRLTGSEDMLDNTHLMRMAGRFSRRLRAWAKANNIPLKDCRAGERVPLFGDFGLVRQLGSADYARPRKFREKLDGWLGLVRTMWPACPASIDAGRTCLVVDQAGAVLRLGEPDART